MSEYKVGDKFEIVKSFYLGHGLQEGDIAEFVRYGYNKELVVLKPAGGLSHEEFYFHIGVDGGNLSTARPLKTEAEKRGAKFGVGGVVNNTSAVKRAIGKKISFVGISKSPVVEESWMCAIEGEDKLTGFLPSSIRLDHEPEYKEIPFSEATHEQRMDVGNLIHGGDAIVKEIYCFQNGGYAYTTNWAKTPSTALFRLTVRIPT